MADATFAAQRWMPLVNGVAALTTTSLTHGSHSVKAEYAGDANFIGASNSLGASQVINTLPATLFW